MLPSGRRKTRRTVRDRPSDNCSRFITFLLCGVGARGPARIAVLSGEHNRRANRSSLPPWDSIFVRSYFMDVPLLGGDSAETWLTAGNGFTCRRRHCLMATCLWAVDRLFSLSAVACLLAAVAAAAGTVRVLASDRDRSSASFHVT